MQSHTASSEKGGRSLTSAGTPYEGAMPVFKRPSRLALVSACLLSGCAAAQVPASNAVTDVIAEQIATDRLRTYIEGGYDPLTAPVDWYYPTRRVAGSYTHTGRLPIAEAGEETIPRGVLEAAAAYAETKDSLALVVIKGGKIELERYWNSTGRDTRFNPQSMSKTVVALLVGIAIQEGRIDGVDDPVSKYVRRLEGDPRGAITLKNLLNMAGGLEQISTSYEITPENRGVRQHFGTSFHEPIFELQLADEPGTRWDYNNNETNLLALALSEAVGQEYTEYLSSRLWSPLGLRDAEMYLDRPGGQVMASCCILSRPLDWARIGMLIRDKGRFGDRQIVPENWIEEMIQPSAVSSGYGYQIWLGDRLVTPVRPESPNKNLSWSSEPYQDEDIIVLNGHGFQRVWIMPSRDLVIVRGGRSWPTHWDESVIPNILARGVADNRVPAQ